MNDNGIASAQRRSQSGLKHIIIMQYYLKLLALNKKKKTIETKSLLKIIE